MNAEKKDCLSSMKGHYPGSRNNFSDSPAILQNTQVCMYFFHAKQLASQPIKSNINDYENRGGE